MHLKVTLIFATAAVVFFLACVGLGQRIDKLREERDQAIEFSNAKDDSLETFINLAGQESKRAAVLDLTVSNMRKLAEDKDLAWVRQFASVNKRLNNIEQATRTVGVASGDFSMSLSEPIIIDFIPDTATASLAPIQPSRFKRTFDNHNEWFRIEGYVTADSVVAKPSVPIILEEVIVWQRKHKFLGIRFGKKEYSSEISTPNPYVEIKEHKVVRGGKKKK